MSVATTHGLGPPSSDEHPEEDEDERITAYKKLALQRIPQR